MSSNNEALKKLSHSIMKHRGSDTTICGPDVWIFSPARNLVGDYYVRDRDLVPESWKNTSREKLWDIRKKLLKGEQDVAMDGT